MGMKKAPVAYTLCVVCLTLAAVFLWQRLQPEPVPQPPPLIVMPPVPPEPVAVPQAPRWPSEEWWTVPFKPYNPTTPAEKEAVQMMRQGYRITPNGPVRAR
jgi:hypothetical protein